jgi:predicted signal transduction protein with EAL and GGDEF domain
VFGHAAGDDLLVQVYCDLRHCLPHGSFMARLGGDEFGVLIMAETAESAQAVCDQMVAVCNTGYSLMGNTVHVGASVGLVHDPANMGHDVIDLMRFADIAMFTAKRDGRGVVKVFDNDMDHSVKFRQSIEEALRLALSRGELTLFYQPIVERQDLRTIGFEALLRWTNPEFGEISPAVFIPIAEESALIHEIGDWVIGTAIRDSLNWPDIYVSINLSSRQFRSVSIIDSLCHHAARWNVPHNRIQVEITETALFEHSGKAGEVVTRLQQLGFRVALDDFGTGYSTLVNVKSFPLDCIKIDKSFIDGLGTERESTVIVSSITHLARGLGLNVVAEGVETDSQCQALRVVGCNQLQGHLFGEAQSLDTATARYSAERDLRNDAEEVSRWASA